MFMTTTLLLQALNNLSGQHDKKLITVFAKKNIYSLMLNESKNNSTFNIINVKQCLIRGWGTASRLRFLNEAIGSFNYSDFVFIH